MQKSTDFNQWTIDSKIKIDIYRYIRKEGSTLRQFLFRKLTSFVFRMRKVFSRSRSCLFLDISGNGSPEVVRGWNYNEGLHTFLPTFSIQTWKRGGKERRRKRERERGTDKFNSWKNLTWPIVIARTSWRYISPFKTIRTAGNIFSERCCRICFLSSLKKERILPRKLRGGDDR